MRILIISAWYSPFIHPRAHRWTSLAEYFAEQGHQVTVLTSRNGDCAKYSNDNKVEIHRTGFDSLKEVFYFLTKTKNARGRVGAQIQKPSLVGKFLQGFYKYFWKNIFFPDDACLWYFPARKKIAQLAENQAFGLIISVSLPFTGHFLGRFAKRKFPAATWVMDIGDPFSIQIVQPNNALFYKNINRKLEKKLLLQSDWVSVTCVETQDLFVREFGVLASDILVIPPLLFPWPLRPPPNPLKGDLITNYELRIMNQDSAQSTPPLGGRGGLITNYELRITNQDSAQSAPPLGGRGAVAAYFGAFYAPNRTPNAILDFLDIVNKESQKVAFHFYGDVFPEFFDQFANRNYVKLQGLQPREKVREAMQQADFLVSIGFKTDFQLPSKTVEYMASGKPILHFSFTAHDPTVAFFEGYAAFLNVKIDEKGGFDLAALPEFEDWLAGKIPAANAEIIRLKIEKSYIENVAAAYLSTLNQKHLKVKTT